MTDEETRQLRKLHLASFPPEAVREEPHHGSGVDQGPTGPTGRDGRVVYDFEKLGVTIAENLILMAKAQVTEANTLLEQTEALADSIRSQCQIQTDALANLNGRLKAFGGELLEAHRKFNGGSHD